MTRRLARPLVIAATALVLAACATSRAPTSDDTATTAAPATLAQPAQPATPTAPADTGPPPHDELYALAWMQTSTEYDALNRSIYGAARVQLDRALADKTWDALPPAERERTEVDPRKLPPAIILDIDETVLENSPFNAALMADPISLDLNVGEWRAVFSERWAKWVDRAAAPRMAGAKEFLDYAASRGVAIFYVTNRACGPGDPQCEEEATCKNLVQQQIPLADCEKNVLLRYEEPAFRTDREKGTRRIAVGHEHRVLMLFGDNLGDFVDGIYGTRDQRDALACAQRDWWGQRWMMLPNPLYGSWVDAADAIGADASNFDAAPARLALARAHKREALVAADAADVTARLNSDCAVP